MGTIWFKCFMVVFILAEIGRLSLCYGIDLTLQWDEHWAPDVIGYKIYYRVNAPGPPYDGTEILEGASPIEMNVQDVYDASGSCRFTLSGLEPDNIYFFAVTAQDVYNNESGFSKEVSFITREDTRYQVQRPLIQQLDPSASPPGSIIQIIGSGFGDGSERDEVHIGYRTYLSTDPRIKVWTDTMIEIRIPFKGKSCDWYAEGYEQYREREIRVIVNAGDALFASNSVPVIVLKPSDCLE